MYYLTSSGFKTEDTYYSNTMFTASSAVYLYYGQQKQYGASVRCVKHEVKIQYDGNNADNGITMSGYEKNTRRGAKVTLDAPNYKRDGYGFLGWSTTQIDPDASDFSTQLANATVYGPSESITVPSNSANTITYYAVWIKSAGNLQGWTGCSSLSTGGVTALKDTRDNQVYAVAKLADGNCWMIENLRLDAANSTDSTKSQGFGGVFGGLANSETATFTDSVLANSLYTTDVTSASLSPITGTDQINRIPRYNNQNTANATSSMTSSTDNVYSYGNYYTWAAAIASTNGEGSAGTSICPYGWHIASGGLNGDYDILNTQINGGSTISSDGLRRFPGNFIYSGGIGSFGDSSIIRRGSRGGYWSVSLYGSGVRFLSFDSGRVDPGTDSYDYEFFGDSVRCMVTSS